MTGGGKTAIYVEAIAASLERGRPALVLVPEIALALPLVDRLRADLDARVALVHSGLGDGERADEWRRIRAGDVDIVVGTRLAVLAPLADVGVDHRRRGARRRPTRATGRRGSRPATRRSGWPSWPARRSCSGRATPGGRERRAAPGPATTTGSSCRRGRSARRPTVEVVDLRAELAAGQRGLLSRALAAALAALDTRRGRAGDPRPQPARDRVGRPVPGLRPRPGLPGLRAAARLPPGRDDAALPPLRPGDAARVALPGLRLAADPLPRRRHGARRARGPRRGSRRCASAGSTATSSSAGAPRSGSSTRSREGRLDVLVGTSLVAKGLDIPKVTLVGVVSSDVALNLPDERAAERTYQLLAQAVGRAGRGDRPGPGDHPDLPARPPGDPRPSRAATGPRSTTRSSTCASGSGRRRSGGWSS